MSGTQPPSAMAPGPAPRGATLLHASPARGVGSQDWALHPRYSCSKPRFLSSFGLGPPRACGELPTGPGAPAPPPANSAPGVNLFQAVPLRWLGKAREQWLFFEAPRPRVGDSASSTSTATSDATSIVAPRPRRETAAHYGPGGGCEPALAIGVDIDGRTAASVSWTRGSSDLRLAHCPLHRVGPGPGTFMWFTTEWRCTTVARLRLQRRLRRWNGTWVVEYREDVRFRQLHVHIGNACRSRALQALLQPPRPSREAPPIRASPSQAGAVGSRDPAAQNRLRRRASRFRERKCISSGWMPRKSSDDDESRLDDFVIFVLRPRTSPG